MITTDFISVDESLPKETGIYEIYSPSYFDRTGRLKYSIRCGWIMNKYIKGFFKVEYWREYKKKINE